MFHDILLFFITGFVGFLAAVIKKSFITFESKFKNMEVANQNMLRSQIVDIYYTYKKTRTIPFYQKEVVNACYDAYANNGGNSFISDLVNDINTWDVE